MLPKHKLVLQAAIPSSRRLQSAPFHYSNLVLIPFVPALGASSRLRFITVILSSSHSSQLSAPLFSSLSLQQCCSRSSPQRPCLAPFYYSSVVLIPFVPALSAPVWLPFITVVLSSSHSSQLSAPLFGSLSLQQCCLRLIRPGPQRLCLTYPPFDGLKPQYIVSRPLNCSRFANELPACLIDNIEEKTLRKYKFIASVI